jgi:CheY-like chemotaxis protein
MDTNVVILIIGLAVVLLIAILLFWGQRRGRPTEATFTLAELFSATVKVGPTPTDTAEANKALREAEKQRGVAPDVEAAVSPPRAAHLARVLWVDDNPDYNIYETVALERLGRVVTKATSTDAGLRYLSELDFALVITDLGRRDDAKGGITLIKQMKKLSSTLPVVVYTLNADQHRHKVDEAMDAGAKAVVETPGQLLRHVDELLASSTATSRTSPPSTPSTDA